MGVWIETLIKAANASYELSHPTWVCGLKLFRLIVLLLLIVTPYVGVWIETIKEENNFVELKVTPYVGVWIETYDSGQSSDLQKSHPTWVCGLKHPHVIVFKTIVKSHPTWVCGLKHQWPSIRQYRRWSHPAWEYMDWSIVHSSVKFMEEL